LDATYLTKTIVPELSATEDTASAVQTQGQHLMDRQTEGKI